VRDVENLREHYELTLRHWVHGLQRNADTVLKHISQDIYRTWLLYMAGSAAAFRRGDLGVYQLLLSRPDRGDSRLPLTREAWYPAQACEHLASRLREEGAPLEWSVLYGKPAAVILGRSLELDSPLIVMPLRWGERLSTMTSDNVGAHVIRSSKVPVMTYRVE
jgi:nucleotide-binding universal stress UspA family protein